MVPPVGRTPRDIYAGSNRKVSVRFSSLKVNGPLVLPIGHDRQCANAVCAPGRPSTAMSSALRDPYRRLVPERAQVRSNGASIVRRHPLLRHRRSHIQGATARFSGETCEVAGKGLRLLRETCGAFCLSYARLLWIC